MSFGGSVRTGIEFDISAPGAGLLDDLGRQINGVKNSLEGVQNMYADGAITGRQYIGQIQNLEKQLKSLQASYDQIVAGIAASQAAIANSGQGFQAWGAVVQNAVKSGKDFTEQLEEIERIGQQYAAQSSARAKADQKLIADKIDATNREIQANEELNRLLAERPASGDTDNERLAKLRAVAEQEKENIALNKMLADSEREIEEAEFQADQRHAESEISRAKLDQKAASDRIDADIAAINAEQAAEEAQYQDTLQRIQKRQQAEQQANQQKIASDHQAAEARKAAIFAEIAAIRATEEAEDAANQQYIEQGSRKAAVDQQIIADKIEATRRELQADEELNRVLAERPPVGDTDSERLAKLRAVADQEKENADLNKILEASERKLTDAELARADASVRQTDAISNAHAAIERRTVAEREAKAAADDMVVADNRIAAAQAELQKAINPERLREMYEAMHQGSVAAVASADADQKLEQAIRGANAAMDEAVGAARQLVAADDQLTESEKKLEAQKKKSGRAASDANDKTQHLIRSVYFASQGIEDMQYSFSAVVNNIPLVVNEVGRAMGASSEKAMAWAAGISLAATAINVLTPVVGKMWKSLTSEEAAKSATHLENLERQLSILKGTHWFIHIDKHDIEDLETKIRHAKRDLQEFIALSDKRTHKQQAAGGIAAEAIVENAGGTDMKSGAENIAKAMEDYRNAHLDKFTSDPQVKALQDARKELKETKEILAIPTLSFEAFQGNTARAANLEGRINDILNALHVRDTATVGRAGEGQASAQDSIASFLAVDPEFFAKRGIGAKFREQLNQARAVSALPSDAFDPNASTFSPDVRKQVEAANLPEHVLSKVEAGKAILSDREKAAAEKKRAEEEQERADEATRLKQIRDKERADEETERINEATRLKQIRDKEKADATAQTERERAVNELARRFAPGMRPDLEEAITEGIAAGGDTDKIRDNLTPKVADRIARNRGGPLSPEAARKIVDEVMAAVDAQIAALPGDRKEAASALHDQQLNRQFDAGHRKGSAERRRDLQQVESDAADRFAAQGASIQQSLALGHETARLFKGGLDFDQAMLQAYLNLTGQTQIMRHMQTQMMHQLQRTIRQQNRRPGGNNRPGRTL